MGRSNHLQHFGDAPGAGVAGGTHHRGEVHQFATGILGHLDRAHLVQAGVHQHIRRDGRRVFGDTLHHRLHARLGGVAQLLGGEVDALHQGAGVDPVGALVPALDAGRVVEELAHEDGLLVAVEDLLAGAVELAGQTQHAGHQLDGALHLAIPDRFVLEEVGVEQGAQHGGDVVAAVKVGFYQQVDGRRVLGLGVGPLRHGRLIGHEEAVQVPGMNRAVASWWQMMSTMSSPFSCPRWPRNSFSPKSWSSSWNSKCQEMRP